MPIWNKRSLVLKGESKRGGFHLKRRHCITVKKNNCAAGGGNLGEKFDRTHGRKAGNRETRLNL